MATYFSSSKVSVFPSALRTAVGDGKFTSENNLTGILRTITGTDSFYRKVDDANYVIVIHGYCFQINDSTIAGKYLNIKLDSSSRLVAAGGSTVLDSNNQFNGLWMTDTADSSATYSLYIGEPNQLYIDANILKNKDALTVGAANKLSTGTTGSANQIVYFSSGVPTGGIHIYTSTSTPTSSDGSNGDIWLQY